MWSSSHGAGHGTAVRRGYVHGRRAKLKALPLIMERRREVVQAGGGRDGGGRERHQACGGASSVARSRSLCFSGMTKQPLAPRRGAGLADYDGAAGRGDAMLPFAMQQASRRSSSPCASTCNGPRASCTRSRCQVL